jgi:hypothetical protein
MATIKFTIAKDGKITSETNGIKGSKCLSVDRFLNDMGTVVMQKTAEFHEDAQDNDVMINTTQS